MKQAVQLPIHWILYPPTDQKKINTVHKYLYFQLSLKQKTKFN